MAKTKKTDITDSDIDALFNNNDTSVLKEPIENNIVPEELSKKNTREVERPKNTDSENTERKKIAKKLAEEIINKIKTKITEVKKLDNYKQVKSYIKSINEYKNEERQRQIKSKAIISGLTQTNLDPSTACKFHIYQPKHIMGNTIYACCKFCSAYKEFSQNEWDDYCLKYRKWF